MRIISGSLKGRRLALPRGVTTRPTPDRVKESLFSILHEEIQESSVLDLFAGSGSLGVESLSRGASWVSFSDMDPRCLQAIGKSLKDFGVGAERYELLRGEFQLILRQLSALGREFDLVFLDPPYGAGYYMDALSALPDILSERAIVVVEHDSSLQLPETVGSLYRYDKRRYGNTSVSLYRGSESIGDMGVSG